MKSKIEKYLKYVAATVFVATLAINVVITLDDPFVLLSDEAIATTNEDSSTVQLFDKEKSDCTITITGATGSSGTWMFLDFTIGASGTVSLTCVNCDIDCPIGTRYLREDCTTADCNQTVIWNK